MDDQSEAERWANLAGLGEPLYEEEEEALRQLRTGE